jgi:hypothetical protein
MGYLNLSGLGIQLQHLLSLRPMFIIELELRDNPGMLVPGLSLSQNRLVLVHLFPRVWVLDGVFITLEERADAATFMENADATLIDATRSGLCACAFRNWLMNSSAWYVLALQVTCVFKPAATAMESQ